MGEGFNLRIKYRIADRLACLSHLETIRSVERIIRRADLPFAITEGFNPHMKIAFGPALPVGAGSEGEYVDVRLREFVDPDEALRLLQDAAPEHLMPVKCSYIDVRAEAITVTYPTSVWRAEFDGGDDPAKVREALMLAFGQLMERGYIEVTKKKGRKAQVKQVVFEGRLVDPPKMECEGSRVVCKFTTFQGDAGALRPDKFIDAALEPMSRPPQLLELTRELLVERPE